MSILQIMEGAAAGLLAAKAEDKLDDYSGQPNHMEGMHKEILHIKESLSDIARFFKQHQEHNAIDTLLTIPVTPAFIRLPTNGRRHTYIFLGVSALLTLNIPGVGSVPFAPPIGWTQLDLPDQTTVWVPAGGSNLQCLYRTTNQSMGASLI